MVTSDMIELKMNMHEYSTGGLTFNFKRRNRHVKFDRKG
jgi:hypothetical protein